LCHIQCKLNIRPIGIYFVNIDTIVGSFVQKFSGPTLLHLFMVPFAFSVLVPYPCLIAVSIGEKALLQ